MCVGQARRNKLSCLLMKDEQTAVQKEEDKEKRSDVEEEKAFVKVVEVLRENKERGEED